MRNVYIPPESQGPPPENDQDKQYTVQSTDEGAVLRPLLFKFYYLQSVML